jgi:ASC-1-like (ASCH) protein
MRIKVFLPCISVVVLALTTLSFSQTTRVVRWEVSGANSKRFFREGVVVKQLLVDGVDEVTVTASIKDRPDSFSVELEVVNRGRRQLELRPQDVQLQVIRPGSKNLSFIPADRIAKRVIDSENLRASGVEASGFTTFKTVVEHVPVTDVTPNPAAINDPTQPAVTVTTRIDVVTKTVPDDHSRWAASSQAASIRMNAEADRRLILNTALKTILLTRDSRIVGRTYYDRENNAQEVLLRIPLGDLTVEIPFTAVRKTMFLAPARIKFE